MRLPQPQGGRKEAGARAVAPDTMKLQAKRTPPHADQNLLSRYAKWLAITLLFAIKQRIKSQARFPQPLSKPSWDLLAGRGEIEIEFYNINYMSVSEIEGQERLSSNCLLESQEMSSQECSESMVSSQFLKRKRITRKNNRKRVVKMVHTCCLFTCDPLGRSQASWHQITRYSHSNDLSSLREKAKKEALQHNRLLTSKQTNAADSSQNASKTDAKPANEAQPVLQPFCFYPLPVMLVL